MVGDFLLLLAHDAFPGGVLVAEEAWEVEAALARTASLIEDVSIPAIFEGAFRAGGVLIRVDILERQPERRWRLIEVKSSAHAKERYVYDVGIQHHVLSACGLDVTSVVLECDESSRSAMPEPSKPKRRISAEGMKRIIAATKKRWRLQRAAAKSAPAATTAQAAG